MAIISFTGLSGTGKSTIATNLANEKNYHYISFNEEVHKLASASHMTAHDYVKKYGIESTSKRANTHILSFIRSHDKKDIIIDGLYDINLANSIRSFNTNFIINVFAEWHMRVMRVANRKHIDLNEARCLCGLRDLYKFELGVASIFKISDMLITNNDDILSATNQCGIYLNKLRR